MAVEGSVWALSGAAVLGISLVSLLGALGLVVRPDALRGALLFLISFLRNDDGEAIYRRCVTPDHHHHLVCRSCGQSVEIASDAVETWADRTARRHGFTSVTHTVEVYGLCRGCS